MPRLPLAPTYPMWSPCLASTPRTGKPHWDALMHVLRYIKGTLHFKITYGSKGFTDLMPVVTIPTNCCPVHHWSRIYVSSKICQTDQVDVLQNGRGRFSPTKACNPLQRQQWRHLTHQEHETQLLLRSKFVTSTENERDSGQSSTNTSNTQQHSQQLSSRVAGIIHFNS